MYDGIRTKYTTEKLAAIKLSNFKSAKLAARKGDDDRSNPRDGSQLSNKLTDMHNRKLANATGLVYPAIRTANASRISDYNLNQHRNASTVEMLDSPIKLVERLRDSKSVNRGSFAKTRSSKKDDQVTKSSNLPQTVGQRRADYASPLRELTHQSDLSAIARKHNIAMDGQVGHGRNLSQSINFASTADCQANGFLPGWGVLRADLK